MSSRRSGGFLLLGACALFASACADRSGRSGDGHGASSAQAPAARESTVGMSARIEEIVLPGPELVVAPLDAKCPVVLRITNVSPHGTAFRYDLEYSGLDPGEYDLRRFLRRKDGTAADKAGSEVPAIPVAIRSMLAPDRIKPNVPGAGSVPAFGGYRSLLVAGAVVWTIGLLALIFARRQRRALEIARAKPRTLAERLRPLVESARAGTLSRADRAALELGLFAYWSRRLGLDEKRPAEALAKMREHADAGPLFQKLEDWLHRPDTRAAVDVAALLAPYGDLPADELDTHLARAEARDPRAAQRWSPRESPRDPKGS